MVELREAERVLVEGLRSWAQTQPSQPGRRFGSEWQIVVEHGRWYAPADFPRALWRRRSRRAHDCYRAAARLAAAVDGLVYVEGFAVADIGEPLVCEHAWCSDAQGNVVDAAWWDEPGTAYLGIPFALDYRDQVVAARRGNRRSFAVLNLYASPELRDGLPTAALA